MREAGLQDRSNFIANLPAILTALDVGRFRGVLAGEIVAVVGAGPSLDDALPALARFTGPIIVVDRALPTLVDAGIDPHYCVTQDPCAPGPVDAFYRRTPKECRLLFHQCASTAFISNWPYARYTAKLIGGRENLSRFSFGLHVGYAAAQLAAYMDAARIVLIGVDLAFRGSITHADGVVDPLEDQSHEVESVRGGTAKTSEGFFHAAQELQLSIGKWRAAVIQTTPFGARLKGAIHMNAEVALRTR